MFCKNCGGEMENGSRFCPYCGDKVASAAPVIEEPAAPVIEEPAAPVQTPAAPVQTPAAPFVQPPVTNYAPQGGYNPGFVPGAPAPVKKKKGKKLIVLVALLAVAAIVAGILFGTGSVDKILAKTGITSPTYEVFEAAKKTVFESESATISTYDENSFEISIGNGLDELKVYYEDEWDKVGIKDGVIYVEGDEEVTINEAIPYIIGTDTIEVLEIGDVEELANKLLKGKIDEKAFADIYNTVFRGVANRYAKLMYIEYSGVSESEMMQYVEVNETTGDFKIKYDAIPVELDLPDYDTVMELVKEFLTKGLSEDAITVTKESGTYKYKINCAEVVKCFADFAKENETVSNIVEDIAEITGADVSEFYEELEYIAEDFAEEGARIKGKAVIEKGYLTYVDAYAYESGEDYKLFEIEVKDINETEVKSSDIDAIETYSPSDDYYW